MTIVGVSKSYSHIVNWKTNHQMIVRIATDSWVSSELSVKSMNYYNLFLLSLRTFWHVESSMHFQYCFNFFSWRNRWVFLMKAWKKFSRRIQLYMYTFLTNHNISQKFNIKLHLVCHYSNLTSLDCFVPRIVKNPDAGR